MGKRDDTGLEVRSGGIRISFYWRGRRCRETLRLEPTSANLTYAARLRAEILRKIELGTFRYGDYFPDSKLATEGHAPILTFRQVAQAWLDSGDLAKSTRNGYRKILEGHLYPAIGDVPMPAITYLKLQDVLSGEWSKKTRNNILICIRRPFDIAQIDGLITANPAARLRYLRAQVPQPDPFEPHEAEAIIEALRCRYGPQEQQRGHWRRSSATRPRISLGIVLTVRSARVDWMAFTRD